MKEKILMLVLLLSTVAVTGQLTITPGATWYMSGNAQLTLQNIDLVNNGIFTAGNSIVSFTGDANSSIKGAQPIQFYELQINKTGGNSVVIQRMISVSQRITFTDGFLNLNAFDLDLGTTAYLNGETETSRIIGLNGGQVLFNAVLNAPAAVNPGSMGAIFTSAQNLGNVIIKRGHQSQTNGSGTGSSVLRYYDITPANNAALNATLRFQYFDAELNALDENTLIFLKSPNNINWTNEGFTTRNTGTNFVELTGINSFSRSTLSSLNNALPVRLIVFNAKCETNNIVLHWKTAQEQNSSYFNIEKSTDGIRWMVISKLTAAGNSSVERSYLFTDNNPVQNSYYRIAQYDLDGRAEYTSVLKTSCNISSDVFAVWPNPFKEMLTINISTNNESQLTIKVFDNRGALVKKQTAMVFTGNNLLQVDMKWLTSGIYHLSIEGSNGQIKKTAQVIKE